MTNKLILRVGQRVQVVKLGDETALPEHLGKTGLIDALTYPTDIGASDGDPFISVELEDGSTEYFWTEELLPLPEITDSIEAPGL